jgi:hypothetical protein
VGAVAGSVIGLATESGVVRGAGIGAISGAVFSIEVAESSRDLWHSTDSAVWSLLYMVRTTALNTWSSPIAPALASCIRKPCLVIKPRRNCKIQSVMLPCLCQFDCHFRTLDIAAALKMSSVRSHVD